MKRTISYDFMKDIILSKLPDIPDIDKVEEVVAISRGGATIGHIISKELKVPMGYYIPNKKRILFGDYPQFIMIVEDLIAQGRTTKELHNVMSDKYPVIDYIYVPFLVDQSFGAPAIGKNRVGERTYDFMFYSTPDWIVFPWEESESVIEGDRGLFRIKTDQYGG